ncbi:serine hydrolase domain-containing protein [Oceanihabitans sp. 2_MG-2023]|uniref:serine hydrolase domain-containing protein n=1 Tax=Oceanihabitans sp. 2_MG-2023 TaxID=3062661 RepID=UPI0026E2B1A1|nr:serine hydrolase domain-containing protein [Oceanihabitans sp. 2_MG-2023]MDO6597295.1 serine hydrolase domain-containing protein [Oceanihabitans sp. 2_MG-2023]
MIRTLLVLLVFIVSNVSKAQNLEPLDSFLDTLNKNNKFMGSLSILKEGEIIYNKQVGNSYINENEKPAITSQSKFRIGSVTKTFTAVMIFQLVDEGKIELDEKLSNYFPKIPNANKITIANLLDHSSGLFNIPRDDNFDEHKPITQKGMLDLIQSHAVDFQPNEKNEYSNTNYILLGYLLEKIDKTTYKSILENRIVSKLQLKNTYYGDVIDITNNECLSYSYEEDGSLYQAKQAHLSNPGGAGAIVSNTTDLVVFMDALFNNKLMSSKSFKAMTTIKGEYGSGIMSAEKGGQTIYAHNGSIDFFKSMVMYIPASKTAIAFTANALDFGLMPIMFNAMAALQGEELFIPSFNSISLTEKELQLYEGVYTCEGLPFNLVFKSNGTALQGGPEGRDLKTLDATSKDQFKLDLGAVLKFNVKEKLLLFEQSGETPKKCLKKE